MAKGAYIMTDTDTQTTDAKAPESALSELIGRWRFRWWNYWHTYDLDSRWDMFRWKLKIIKSVIRGKIIIALDWGARQLLNFACWLARRWSRRVWWENTNYGKQTPMLRWHGKLAHVGDACEYCDIDVSKHDARLSRIMSADDCTYPQAVERMVDAGLASTSNQ